MLLHVNRWRFCQSEKVYRGVDLHSSDSFHYLLAAQLATDGLTDRRNAMHASRRSGPNQD